jgi:excisionase family DNA binding protein
VLPIVVDNQTYLTAAEAARRLHISRETFTRNVGSRLRKYQFGALRRIYYLQSDVDAYSGLREVEDSNSEDGE